jgi:cytochrome o ubiquinol oxidase operon protein cyoD
MIYFLHMNTRVEGGCPMLALLFTAVLVLIMLAGSMMYNLNTNMMPVHDMLGHAQPTLTHEHRH